MKKTISVRQFATIKRVAQNVNPAVLKKSKIAAKIDELNAKYNELTEEISGHEMGIKAITGGLSSEDLVIKKVEDTGKVDKEGRPIKITKYEMNPEMVTYDADKNVYIVGKDEPEVEEVECEWVDETEKAPEVEVTNETFAVEDTEKLPFE